MPPIGLGTACLSFQFGHGSSHFRDDWFDIRRHRLARTTSWLASTNGGAIARIEIEKAHIFVHPRTRSTLLGMQA